MILAGAAQADLLAALHAACFPQPDRWNAASMQELLAMPGCFACVAEDPSPVGLALARVAADEAELLTIGVLAASRRRGVGQLLFDEVVGEAAGRGARRLFLEVSVRNVPALALYGRRGAVEVGRRRGYYPDGADALILALPIAAPVSGA